MIVIDSISSAFYNFIVTMTTEDIQKLRDLGEVSKVQFKERILDKYDIGCELVEVNLSLASTTRQELLIRCRMPKCRKPPIY